MSAMLEQSIIDAVALKEVAMKNAETVLIEKYSNKIKEAVDKLLEQDDELFSEEEPSNLSDIGIDTGEPSGEESPIISDIPMAATDGEKMCQCPAEEEEIEIDFSELEKEMNQADEIGELGQPNEQEEMLGDIPIEGEEVELKEGEISSILEELSVDNEPVPSGWLATNKQQREEIADETIAKELECEEEKEPEKDKDEEEYKELTKKIEDKEKEIESFMAENKTINEELKIKKEENNKLKKYVLEVKDKLQEMNIKNAKLLYMNRVLDNGSLNERQKKTIVESLSKTSSVEQTKAVYEALQNTPGISSNNKKSPKTLNEALLKPSINLQPKRGEEQLDPQGDRLRRLAGIKTNK